MTAGSGWCAGDDGGVGVLVVGGRVEFVGGEEGEEERGVVVVLGEVVGAAEAVLVVVDWIFCVTVTVTVDAAVFVTVAVSCWVIVTVA